MMSGSVVLRDPRTGTQIRIGAMGSAGTDIDVAVGEQCRALGRAIASRGCCLLTGACPGLPHEVVLGAAAHGGHVDTVKALLKHRPSLDVRDASFNATPLGWAVHGWWERRHDVAARREPYYEIVALLVAAGSPVEPAWLSEEHARTDPRMFGALTGS